MSHGENGVFGWFSPISSEVANLACSLHFVHSSVVASSL